MAAAREGLCRTLIISVEARLGESRLQTDGEALQLQSVRLCVRDPSNREQPCWGGALHVAASMPLAASSSCTSQRQHSGLGLLVVRQSGASVVRMVVVHRPGDEGIDWVLCHNGLEWRGQLGRLHLGVRLPAVKVCWLGAATRRCTVQLCLEHARQIAGRGEGPRMACW
jgi:hypothetical protein